MFSGSSAGGSRASVVRGGLLLKPGTVLFVRVCSIMLGLFALMRGSLGLLVLWLCLYRCVAVGLCCVDFGWLGSVVGLVRCGSSGCLCFHFVVLRFFRIVGCCSSCSLLVGLRFCLCCWYCWVCGVFNSSCAFLGCFSCS